MNFNLTKKSSRSTMERSESALPLLDNDFLDNEYEGGSSSGYESNESMSRDPSPAPCRPSRSANSPVMIFKNTSDLQNSLAFILSMPELCDVTFLVGKDQVPVHGVKAILATRSRRLYQLLMYHQRTAEVDGRKHKKRKSKNAGLHPNKLCINIPDYLASDFTTFMAFVHCGKVRVTLRNVMGLLCASAEFGMRDLQTACEDFIRRCVNQGQTRDIQMSATHYQDRKPVRKILSKLS